MIDQRLLLDFFLSFSRFEFALVSGGFYLAVQRPKNKKKEEGKEFDGVKSDWRSFEKSIKDIFDKNAEQDLIVACTYYLDDPPRRLSLINRQLMWETQTLREGESESEFLLRMVRSVRNNIFHGAKHNIGPHEEKMRTELLLSNALIILKYSLHLSPHVEAIYNDAVI